MLLFVQKCIFSFFCVCVRVCASAHARVCVCMRVCVHACIRVVFVYVERPWLEDGFDDWCARIQVLKKSSS